MRKPNLKSILFAILIVMLAGAIWYAVKTWPREPQATITVVAQVAFDREAGETGQDFQARVSNFAKDMVKSYPTVTIKYFYEIDGCRGAVVILESNKIPQ